MNELSSGSGHTYGTPRHPTIIKPILSKRVCFYKSGDPQFNGLRMVINNHTFKTFDALLDSLSKKVPLPFGVRNITTPRGGHAVCTLDELEDGKSYICSDSHKVKPIDLAVARRKLPPWYYARPVSSRHQIMQQARLFPGRNIHKQEPVVVRAPKRLLVFCNGDPTVKHTVLLHKRTTPTFESILEYISEVIQFPVVKLHTPDGRRVDGLSGLIFCPGIVVAAGREPFRPAEYNAQNSLAPKWLPTNQMGLRGLKGLKRKKKILSYTSKPRSFSPSSERYIVNRIHNSIAEKSFDPPNNPTNSVELESTRILESVADVEGDTCLGSEAERQGFLLPTEDDIEKSFRINQDGSMTVEMRVRLTLKEEETIHWMTTLKRSSVANQLHAPESEAEQEICSPKLDSVDSQSPAASTINKDKTKDSDDEDPPSVSKGILGENGNEENNIKVQTDGVLPRRAPTPERKQIRNKQASVESIKSVMAEGIQGGMVGSYSHREQIENGAMTEQYCMVRRSSTRPVPKPRRLGSVDANNIHSGNVSTFKSAEMTEMLPIESSGEEVTETVLNIYEQQTCQDNFLANFCVLDMHPSGMLSGRPATSETGQLPLRNEPEHWKPSSESISNWRAESKSAISDLTLLSLKTGAIQATNVQQQSARGKHKLQQREVSKGKRVPSKSRLIDKLISPRKKQKEKRRKTLSSAGFIKRIYGSKSKSAKSTVKLRKRPTQNGDRGVTTKSSQHSDGTIKCILKDPNMLSKLKENTSETVSLETSRATVCSTEVSQPRRILTRQTSRCQEKKTENVSLVISESMSLPGFITSDSVTNAFVDKWLEKAHPNLTASPDEKSQKLEAVMLVQTENSMSAESGNSGRLITAAEKVKILEEKSETQTCQTLKSDLLPESLLGPPVKQRIQTFENKTSPTVGKTDVSRQTVQSHDTTTNKANGTSITQNNTEEVKPLSNAICFKINCLTKFSTEIPSDSEVEIKSSPIKISLQEATPSNMLSLNIPPPPAENTEQSDTEYCVMGVSSVRGGLSLVRSQTPDNHPLSISSTCDKAVSPSGHTMEMTTSIQTDIPSSLREASLPRTPSIKRSPLVSNLSLEKKMSLRKACLDKYTLCTNDSSETTSSSAAINTVGDNVLPNGVTSTRTRQPRKPQKSVVALMSSSSGCTSASPASLTSDDRTSASISSSEAPTSSNLPLKEIKVTKMPVSTQKESSSLKPLVKNVKFASSPSPERKHRAKKLFSDLHNNPPLHNHAHHTTMSPIIGKHAPPSAARPSTEKKQILHKTTLQKRPSPYSQSLDMVSPPVRHKQSRKMLSGHLFSDSASEPANRTQRTSSQKKHNQTSQSIKSVAMLDRTLMCETLVLKDRKEKMIDHLTNADTQTMPQPLNIANQPNMKPVLEKICYSIKSIRQIAQNKCPSCLEKSSSLPDFSSHVASTFGLSCKALLAFLSVMTLKEGTANFSMDELNANNVGCAEALKMIDSLREIASMEDSHELKCSLSDLQQSVSKQLLQSWKSFQKLSDQCKSRTSPKYSDEGVITEAGPDKDCDIEENFINEIMDSFDIPEMLKKELASFSAGLPSETDDDKKLSARIIQKYEQSPSENSDTRVSQSSTEEAVNVRDDINDDKSHVHMSSIIKKFTDINKPKPSNMGCVPLIRETAKHKGARDKDGQYEQTIEAKCQPAEPNEKQTHKERQLYATVLLMKENGELCRYVVHEENQEENKQHRGHIKGRANMNGVVNSKTDLEKESIGLETEKQDSECRQIHSEESRSVPVNELIYGDESGPDEEEQNMLSAIKDVEAKESCKERVSSSEISEQYNSEEQPQVEFKEQESSEGDLSNHESHSEEQDYVELNVSRKENISSTVNKHRSFSEEEQPEVGCKEPNTKGTLNNPESPSDQEEEQETQKLRMEPNVSDEESTGSLDADEPSSSGGEQLEMKCKELKVMSEGLPGPEEEQESVEEHTDDQPGHEKEKCKRLKALIEATEEDKVGLGNKTKTQSTEGEELSILLGNQDLYVKKDNSSLIKTDRLSKFNADEDSGNDHSSCEEQSQIKDEQISSSTEEELRHYEKEFPSEEEHAHNNKHIEESYQEAPASECEVTKREKAIEKLKHQSEEIISQSVAERVSLLEKQVADAQRRETGTGSSAIRRFSQRNSHLEDSPSPTSQSALCTRSAPQSSLSFSYNSSGIKTTEPEGNRVRSIRELFLAKSATDTQQGQRRFPSPDPSTFRTETSASGSYQSPTSSEPSSGEDDSSRKTITKGFVRRTIERLYGRRDTSPDVEAGERPPSAPKQKKKEHSNIFHTVQSKAMSELSYFSSTNAMDTLNEATRTTAFNAQVGPGGSVPIANGRWLLRENTLIRKSVSDPAGINKAFTNPLQGEGLCEDTEENTSYSPSSTKSEGEDKQASFSRKCTYFSLPHASDSDVCQDDLSTGNKSSVNGDSITDMKDNSEDSKMWVERHNTLPVNSVTDFRMMDNKVHPLIEAPADGEVVVVQPGKGQRALNRRLQEPDVLDLLYNFCGQHCPIL